MIGYMQYETYSSPINVPTWNPHLAIQGFASAPAFLSHMKSHLLSSLAHFALSALLPLLVFRNRQRAAQALLSIRSSGATDRGGSVD